MKQNLLAPPILLLGERLTAEQRSNITKMFPNSPTFQLGDTTSDQWRLPRDEHRLFPLLKSGEYCVLLLGFDQIDTTVRHYLTKAKRANKPIIHVNENEEYLKYVRPRELWYTSLTEYLAT